MCLEITNKYSTKMKEEEKKDQKKLSNEELEKVNGGLIREFDWDQ